ncbi:MAG: hypothetical protein LBH78_03485 [Rickettsiales bacterium]|nr:hypothetical protein [Rickettsiales bacterium]
MNTDDTKKGLMIDGKQASFYQKKNSVSLYYINTLKREVSQAINELPFAQVTRINQGSKTDSLYFEIKMLHHKEKRIVSVRTHPPLKVKWNVLIFYATNFASVKELRMTIQKKLINIYNIRARELGFKQQEVPYNKPKAKLTTKQVTTPLKLDEEYTQILQKAYEDKIVRNGWANLTEVTKRLGSTYNITTKELGVNKLSKAYIQSELYTVTDIEQRGKIEKWIKLKDHSS